MIRECLYCGENFDVPLSHAGRYCSRAHAAAGGRMPAGWTANHNALAMIAAATDTYVNVASWMGCTAVHIYKLRRRHRQPIKHEQCWEAWTDAEDEMIRTLYPTMSTPELSIIMNVNRSTIDIRAKKIGVQKSPAYLVENRAAYVLYPPELRDAIRLQKQLRKEIKDVKKR